MNRNRNDYEPIIAERRSREPARGEAQPVWRLALALGAGLVVAALLAWWLMRGSSSDGTPKTAPSAPEDRAEALPEERIEQTPLPPARDLESDGSLAQAPELPAPAAESAAGAEQAPTPESAAEEGPGNAAQASVPPPPVSVRFMSPDTQVRIELRGPLESSPPVTGKAGDVVAVAPGTYRVIASGSGWRRSSKR